MSMEGRDLRGLDLARARSVSHNSVVHSGRTSETATSLSPQISEERGAAQAVQ